jgi:hypothetical protein
MNALAAADASLPLLRADVLEFALALQKAAAYRGCAFVVFVTTTGKLAREQKNTLQAMRLLRAAPELVVGVYDEHVDPHELVVDICAARRCL